MLDTRPVQFPQVEHQKAKSTDEEHNDKEGVSGAYNYIKGKWKQDRHVVHLKFMYLLQPSLNYRVLFCWLARFRNCNFKSLM